MGSQGGGSFLPGEDVTFTGAVTFATAPTTTGAGTAVNTTATQTLTNKTLTSPALNTATITNPTINGTAFATGQTVSVWESVAVVGTTIHAAVTPLWVVPATCFVLRVLLDITTASTGASTLDIGYTAVGATTTSDSMLDGVSGTPAAVFDSMNAALDSGANAKAQRAAAAKWITATEASGDSTGLVGTLRIEYLLV